MAEKGCGKAINRLNTVREVRPLIDRMYQEGIEATSSGKPVVWAMVNWWHADPVLEAMDLVAIYLAKIAILS